MSMINFYGDSTITVWEVDNNGDKVSVPILNERKQVIGNKIVLEGLPDEQYRVFIDGFVEIGIKEKTINTNQFKVDYRKNGVVFVHESLDGQWLNIGKYFSRGMYYLPASRIWTKVNDFGEVIETLDAVVDRIELVISVISNLDESIGTATMLKSDLERCILDGNVLKTELPPLVGNANASKINLDSSINNATVFKSNLDDSISTANTKNLELDISIANADSINDTLSNPITGTIKKATDINTVLKTNIDTATTKNNDLQGTIDDSNTSKINLQNTIGIADIAQTNLDSSIVSGEILKGELEGIIVGTNIEQLAIDVDSLKIDQHNHNNKTVIDGLSDVDGLLQYNSQSIGDGDMTKSIYDTSNNGKVDIAENAEKLEGKTLTEIYADIPEGTTVTDSTTNGNIVVNGTEIQIYDDSTVESNIDDLAGVGRTTETVKDNSDKIGILSGVRIHVGNTQPTDTIFWLDTTP